MKIHQVGAILFHADRQTGRQMNMTKLIFVFQNSVIAPGKKKLVA